MSRLGVLTAMDYLLKSTICLTAFYGLYYFGFRRLSFHTLNRFYLLVSLALSLTIPLLSYDRTEVVMFESQPIEEVIMPTKEVQEADNQQTTIQQSTNIDNSPNTTIDWIQVLNSIYLLGVGLMFILFVKNLLTIIYCIKKTSASAATRSHRKNLKIVLTKNHSNSSFFNYIFLNTDNLNPYEETLIITHESFHAQRLHSLDLLVLSILKTVFWFNPVIYFYQKSLKQIHEYEVDFLMSATHNSREYAHLLLKLSVSPNTLTTNQFSTKPLKERIHFLFKKPTHNMKKLLYLLSLPIVAVGVMAFAEKKVVKVYQEQFKQKNISEPLSKTDILPEENPVKKEIFDTDTLKVKKISKIDSSKFIHLVPVPIGLSKDYKIYSDETLLLAGENYIRIDNRIYFDKQYSKIRIQYATNDKIFSVIFGEKEHSKLILYPNLTKLEENTYPIFDRIKALPIFTTSRENTIPQLTSKLPKTPTPFSNIAKNQDTLRTILETNKLGKNPLVFINGEEYPSSVLYRINPNSTRGYQIYSKGSQRAIEKYGLRAEDGVLILNLVKNEALLIENEKQYRIAIDNVKKQLNAPKKRVQRVVLKDLDGKEYEKVSVMRIDKSTLNFSVDVPIGGKILYLVDGKIMSEEDIERGNQIFNSGGCGEKFGAELISLLGDSVKNYDAYFNLYTK